MWVLFILVGWSSDTQMQQIHFNDRDLCLAAEKQIGTFSQNPPKLYTACVQVSD